MIIKAISLWQPWATAWVLGLKRGETRHWAPMLKRAIYRGPLAVHAALAERDPVTRESIRDWFDRRMEDCRQSREAFARAGIKEWSDLPRGAMLGLCTLDDVRPSILCGPHNSLEASWGDYSRGRFIWLPANMTALKTPIPCKGRQGLFNWEVPAELFADEQFAPILRGVRTVPVQAECTPQVRALGADAQAPAATSATTAAK